MMSIYSGFVIIIVLQCVCTDKGDYPSQCNDGIDANTQSESYDPESNDCPSEGDRSLWTSRESNVPWGDPVRAYKTVPKGLKVAPSRISGAGLGVFATTLIRKYTWLGPYEGAIVPWYTVEDVDADRGYSWMAEYGKQSYWIDGADVSTSSYTRFFNTAKSFNVQNVVEYHCKGRIHFATRMDVYPGQELLTFYGEDYAKTLGIDMESYYDNPNKTTIIT